MVEVAFVGGPDGDLIVLDYVHPGLGAVLSISLEIQGNTVPPSDPDVVLGWYDRGGFRPFGTVLFSNPAPGGVGVWEFQHPVTKDLSSTRIAVRPRGLDTIPVSVNIDVASSGGRRPVSDRLPPPRLEAS